MPYPTAGFTAVVCSRCTSAESVLDELRAAVRRAPHGMLISSGCLLDQIRCVGRTDGVMVLVQPCAIDRTPTGPAIMFGPIEDAASAAQLRDWLDQGHWAAPLPVAVMNGRSV